MKTTLKIAFILTAVLSLSGCSAILVSLALEKKMPVVENEFDDTFRDTTIMKDGVKLHAYYSPSPGGSKKTAIVVHGYTSRPARMLKHAAMFRDSLGYNVWLPALRCHDKSGGSVIQMGWNDRLDVLEWTKVAHEHFSDTLQVVLGVSMGGATTMMLSGENTPDYVKGFIDDCGYTSVWDQFSYNIVNDYNLPVKPTLYNAEKIIKKRYNWDFHEASSVNQLKNCSKPMLFIHGDNDDFVPTRMVYENYFAKSQGYKEIWMAKGSKHARAFHDHPAEYTAVVREFLKKHVE